MIEELFKRKAQQLRGYLILFVLQEDDANIISLISNLTQSKNLVQRLAGLEIMVRLYQKKELLEFIDKEIELYKKRKKISKSEEVQLEKFQAKKEAKFSKKNGFGIVDYDNLEPDYEPKDKFASIPKNRNVFDKLIDRNKISKAINSLLALFNNNVNHEYRYEDWDGELVSTILINRISYSKRDTTKLTKEEKFRLLPLWEVWEKWYRESKLNDYEMMVAYSATTSKSYRYQKRAYKELIERYYPLIENLELKIEDGWNSLDTKIHRLIRDVVERFCDKSKMTSLRLDIAESILVNYPKQYHNIFTYVIGEHLNDFSTTELMERSWRLDNHCFLLASQKKSVYKNNLLPAPSFTLHLYEKGILNSDDFLNHLLLDGKSFIPMFELKKNQEKSYYKGLPLG